MRRQGSKGDLLAEAGVHRFLVDVSGDRHILEPEPLRLEQCELGVERPAGVGYWSSLDRSDSRSAMNWRGVTISMPS